MGKISNIQIFLDKLICPSCFVSNLTLRAEELSCHKCGANFSVKNDKVFFTEAADEFSEKIIPSHFMKEKWSKWRLANFEYFKNKLAQIEDSASLLDLGAGPSQFRELISRFKLSIGVDFRPLELVSVVSDLTKKLPFHESSFDVVIMSNTMEHIPNTEFLLSEVYRILRPGGIIIGTIPFLMRVHQKPYDYNRYTYYMLEKFLEDASFKEIEVTSLGKSIDVYESIQLHFFYYLLGTKFSNNKVVSSFKKFFARVVWRLQLFIFSLFLPLYKNATNSPDFTQGYGFFAKK